VASLKERFEKFMAGVSSVENVDALLKNCDLPGRMRADYLAFRRRVIIEQKSLEVDADTKIQAFVDDLARTRGIKGEGEISISEFLSRLPDGKALGLQLFGKITKGVDDILAKADKQTADTRKTFVIPDAFGFVIILNDAAQMIGPDFVAIKAFEMLRKKTPSGAIRYPSNQVVLVISEAHRVVTPEPVELVPIETIISETGQQNPLVAQLATTLVKRWAEFNGVSYVEDADMGRIARPRDRSKMQL
jgi:hypothetical protein